MVVEVSALEGALETANVQGENVIISKEAANYLFTHLSEGWPRTLSIVHGLDGLVRKLRLQAHEQELRANEMQRLASMYQQLYRAAQSEVEAASSGYTMPSVIAVSASTAVLGLIGGAFAGANFKQCVGPSSP